MELEASTPFLCFIFIFHFLPRNDHWSSTTSSTFDAKIWHFKWHLWPWITAPCEDLNKNDLLEELDPEDPLIWSRRLSFSPLKCTSKKPRCVECVDSQRVKNRKKLSHTYNQQTTEVCCYATVRTCFFHWKYMQRGKSSSSWIRRSFGMPEVNADRLKHGVVTVTINMLAYF